MVVNVLKFVKVVNVVLISHAAVVYMVNVVQEKCASQTFVCAVHDQVDVVHMNIVSMANVSVKQVFAINVTMHAKLMKFVSMENVFARNDVIKVKHRIDLIYWC